MLTFLFSFRHEPRWAAYSAPQTPVWWDSKNPAPFPPFGPQAAALPALLIPTQYIIVPIFTSTLRCLTEARHMTYRSLRSVHLFLHSSRHSVPTGVLYNAPPVSRKIAPSTGIWIPPSNTQFLWPTRAHKPSGISIGLSCFAGLTTLTDMQTDACTLLGL